MDSLLLVKSPDSLMKSAYGFVDRDHSGRIERHEWIPAYMFLIGEAGQPVVDIEAAEKVFNSLDRDHDGEILKQQFYHWFETHLSKPLAIEELRLRVYHLSGFVNRKHHFVELFHYLDESKANRLSAATVKSFLQHEWKELSKEKGNKLVGRMDPKKSGYVTVYPFLACMYWFTKNDHMDVLAPKLDCVKSAGRHRLIHRVFEAFSHHRGYLTEEELKAFAQLNPTQVTKGKVKGLTMKQAEVVKKLDRVIHSKPEKNLEEKEFVPLLEEATANLKATQLNKLVDGYIEAVTGPSQVASVGSGDIEVVTALKAVRGGKGETKKEE